jgi:hypothetical protein
MIICIDVSQRTKDALEKLLEIGGYRNYSEAAAVAIANQLLLQNHASGNSTKADTLEMPTASIQRLAEETIGNRPSSGNSGTPEIPETFSFLTEEIDASIFSVSPDDDFEAGREIPVDRWIFGQYNKLLPVKATCRAMARFMCFGIRNFSVAKIAPEIASEAVKLGDYLRRLDQTSGMHHDDALSFAFPYSSSANADKSRLRYANQFVVSSGKQGTLTGLPVELKLISRHPTLGGAVSLTETGWLFARLRNPILDDAGDGRQPRFSKEEIAFLISHIRNRVPAEAFAYNVVLAAIARGANTPEKLDDALQVYVPQRHAKPFTRAFLTTQRAGVVSRMIELGLIRRVRDGIKVTYSTSADTFDFSPNPLQKAV